MIDVSKIKRNTGQTEASVYMTGNQTNRSLDPKSAQNAALDFTYEKWDLAKMQAVFSELLIRFDTAPQFYTKQDYEHLIRMIGNGFYSILVDQQKIEIDTDWANPTNGRVPSTLLVKTEFDKFQAQLDNRINQVNANINSINDHLTTVDADIALLKSEMVKQSDLEALKIEITNAYNQAIKQLREDLEAEFAEGLEGKANRSHTHIAADINDFEPKVQEIIDKQVWWADITGEDTPVQPDPEPDPDIKFKKITTQDELTALGDSFKAVLVYNGLMFTAVNGTTPNSNSYTISSELISGDEITADDNIGNYVLTFEKQTSGDFLITRVDGQQLLSTRNASNFGETGSEISINFVDEKLQVLAGSSLFKWDNRSSKNVFAFIQSSLETHPSIYIQQ